MTNEEMNGPMQIREARTGTRMQGSCMGQIRIYKLRNAVTATETIAYLPRLNKIGSLRHIKDKTIPVRLLKLHVNVQFYNF